MRAFLVTITGLMSICLHVQAEQNSCKALFDQPQASLLSLISEAETLSMSKTGDVSPVAKQAKLKLFEIMGVEDSISLLGSEFNNWPILLGVSSDGHIILAKSDLSTHEVKIMSLKRLDISTEDYVKRRRQDFSVTEGQTPPAGYEKTEDWLQRSEGDFNQIIDSFSKKTHFWIKQDYDYHRLTDAVQTHGTLGVFKQPWIIRSAGLYTPTANGQSATKSTPEDIESLVQALMQSK